MEINYFFIYNSDTLYQIEGTLSFKKTPKTGKKSVMPKISSPLTARALSPLKPVFSPHSIEKPSVSASDSDLSAFGDLYLPPTPSPTVTMSPTVALSPTTTTSAPPPEPPPRNQIKIENVADKPVYSIWDPRRLFAKGERLLARWFHFFSRSPLSETYGQKARRLEHVFNAAMASTGRPFATLARAQRTLDVEVRVQTRRQWNATGSGYSPLTVPAYVGTDVGESCTTANVTLGSWYFENYSLGFCLGMLAHELGTHTIPATLKVASDDDGEAEASTAQQVVVAPPGVDLSVLDTIPTDDHFLAAKPGTSNYRNYQGLVLSLATALEQSDFPDKEVELQKLFHCYFFDVATILACADDRNLGFNPFSSYPRRIAQAFNFYRAQLEATLMADPTKQHLLRYLPREQTAGDMRKDYFKVFRSIFGAFGRNPSTFSSPQFSREIQEPTVQPSSAPPTV